MAEMGLVLQGGGALGAYEYGVVTRLVELGWRPKAVTGVSIGAINAAAVAGAAHNQIADNLHKLWDTITMMNNPWLPADQQGFLSMFGNRNFFRPRIDFYDIFHWTSLCDVSPMIATLNRICDFDLINNSNHIRFAVTATDLQTGGQVTFSNFFPDTARVTRDDPDKIERDSVTSLRTEIKAEHIMASGSLPPGFSATEIDGAYYWDGGLFSNTPIEALLDLLDQKDIESLPIFVVNLFPCRKRIPENLLQVQERMTELSYQNRFWAQYGGTSRLTGFMQVLKDLDEELPKDSAARKHRAFYWLQRLRALENLHVIQAEAAPMTGGMDFSPYGIGTRYQAGRKAVDDYFERNAVQWQADLPRMRVGIAGSSVR